MLVGLIRGQQDVRRSISLLAITFFIGLAVISSLLLFSAKQTFTSSIHWQKTRKSTGQFPWAASEELLHQTDRSAQHSTALNPPYTKPWCKPFVEASATQVCSRKPSLGSSQWWSIPGISSWYPLTNPGRFTFNYRHQTWRSKHINNHS